MYLFPRGPGQAPQWAFLDTSAHDRIAGSLEGSWIDFREIDSWHVSSCCWSQRLQVHGRVTHSQRPRENNTNQVSALGRSSKSLAFNLCQSYNLSHQILIPHKSKLPYFSFLHLFPMSPQKKFAPRLLAQTRIGVVVDILFSPRRKQKMPIRRASRPVGEDEV